MATSTARKTGTGRKTASARPARKTAAPAAATPPDAPAPASEAPKKRPAADKPRADQPKRVKLVRDSFTFPKLEYGLVGVLKTRASHLGRPTKKSEIVRAGIKALLGMSDADFMACVASLTPAKTKSDKT